MKVDCGRTLRLNDIKLRKNDFFEGETVYSPTGIGIVESWNNKIEYLKVSTDSDLLIGEILTGQSSNTRGVIKKKIDFKIIYIP